MKSSRLFLGAQADLQAHFRTRNDVVANVMAKSAILAKQSQGKAAQGSPASRCLPWKEWRRAWRGHGWLCFASLPGPPAQ
jgi:hypothetical protein